MDDIEDIVARHSGIARQALEGMIEIHPGMPFQPMFVVVREEGDIDLVEVGYPEDNNMPQRVYNLAVAVLAYFEHNHIDVRAILFVTDTFTWIGNSPVPPGKSMADLFEEDHPNVYEALYVIGGDRESSFGLFLPYRRCGDHVHWLEALHPEFCANGCDLAITAAFGIDFTKMVPE